MQYIYRLLKLLFIVWMIHPRYQGALYTYFAHVEQRFGENEKRIRKQSSQLLTDIPNFLSNILDSVLGMLSQKGNRRRILDLQR